MERLFPLFSRFPFLLQPTKPIQPILPLYPYPFPTFPPIPTAAPTTPAPNQTCICVPIGSCSTSNGSTDGSGLLDLRIVSEIKFQQRRKLNSLRIPQSASSLQTSCYPNLQLCCYSGAYQCGVRYPPVAGSPVAVGDQANYGAFPWQAVLLGPNGVFQGSGVLLDSLSVLTVAHKVANYS